MSKRPNIVLITTDQQRFDTLQAAGHKHVWTPHLDWLADSGIRFTRAYSDCPVCGPARVTLMTGRHAYNHRILSNKHLPSALQATSSLPARLTQAGYQTRHIGKTHFGPDRRSQGYEHIEHRSQYGRWLRRAAPHDTAQLHGVGNNEFAPAVNPLPQHQTETAWIVDRGVDFLDDHDLTRPFYLHLSFFHPHPPFTPSAEHMALYQSKKMPRRRVGDWSGDPDGVPPAFQAVTRELSMTHRFDDDQIEELSRAYHACVSEIDYQLGRFFGRLKELGYLENTWIVFTTDHGEMLGDHYMGGKCVPLETSAHIPLLVRPPHAARDTAHAWRGATCDDLVCLADLPATFTELGESEPLPEVDGISLLPFLQGESVGRDTMFISCMYLHAVVEGQWKLCRETLDGTELLFKLDEDPYEQRNLLNDPAALPVLEDLRVKLDKHLDEKNLANGVPHDPAVIRDTSHLPHHTHPGIVSGTEPLG